MANSRENQKPAKILMLSPEIFQLDEEFRFKELGEDPEQKKPDEELAVIFAVNVRSVSAIQSAAEHDLELLRKKMADIAEDESKRLDYMPDYVRMAALLMNIRKNIADNEMQEADKNAVSRASSAVHMPLGSDKVVYIPAPQPQKP